MTKNGLLDAQTLPSCQSRHHTHMALLFELIECQYTQKDYPKLWCLAGFRFYSCKSCFGKLLQISILHLCMVFVLGFQSVFLQNSICYLRIAFFAEFHSVFVCKCVPLICAWFLSLTSTQCFVTPEGVCNTSPC